MGVTPGEGADALGRPDGTRRHDGYAEPGEPDARCRPKRLDLGHPSRLPRCRPTQSVRKSQDLRLPDSRHVPWPNRMVDEIRAHGPQDIVRVVDLGIMTGQRASDLVRFGPTHRGKSGLRCRARTTATKRRAFFLPLPITEALTLDRWATPPITFANARWLAPIEGDREDLYLQTPMGKNDTPDRIRARWTRWRKGCTASFCAGDSGHGSRSRSSATAGRSRRRRRGGRPCMGCAERRS